MTKRYHKTKKKNTTHINSTNGVVKEVVTSHIEKEKTPQHGASPVGGFSNDIINQEEYGGLLNNSHYDHYREEIEQAYHEYCQEMEKINKEIKELRKMKQEIEEDIAIMHTTHSTRGNKSVSV